MKTREFCNMKRKTKFCCQKSADKKRTKKAVYKVVCKVVCSRQ